MGVAHEHSFSYQNLTHATLCQTWCFMCSTLQNHTHLFLVTLPGLSFNIGNLTLCSVRQLLCCFRWFMNILANYRDLRYGDLMENCQACFFLHKFSSLQIKDFKMASEVIQRVSCNHLSLRSASHSRNYSRPYVICPGHFFWWYWFLLICKSRQEDFFDIRITLYFLW